MDDQTTTGKKNRLVTSAVHGGSWVSHPYSLFGLLAALTVVLIGAGGTDDTEAGDTAVHTIDPMQPQPPLSSPADPRPADYNPWHTLEAGEYRAYNQRASLLQRGKAVYAKYCIGCHGENGDGHGPAAARLITQPRDFTKGIYKFRSTDSGSLPLDSDLHRTITDGLSRVSMPAFPLMPEQEKVAVIEYIKSFYPEWEKEKADRKIVPVPAAPTDLDTPERIFRGRIVYLAMQCGKCHGSDGAGTGATQAEYIDAWGNPQKPLNFTRGQLKGGDNPEDIYRTFHTGLRSIMPAYGGVTLAAVNLETFESQKMFLREGELDQLKPFLDAFPQTAGDVFTEMDEGQRQQLVDRNSWNLVAYVLSLQKKISTAAAVLGRGLRAGPADGPDGQNP